MTAAQNVEAKEERRMNRGHGGAEPAMYGELAPNGVTQMKCALANKSIRIIRRTQKPQKPQNAYKFVFVARRRHAFASLPNWRTFDKRFWR